jgi:NTE family protein
MPDLAPAVPVTILPGDERKPLETGIAVCLSGGGYRAMLFHTGVLWRLLELGLLGSAPRTVALPGGDRENVGAFRRISSVSGGSITSAMLGLQWAAVSADPARAVERYRELVVGPIRKLAGKTLAAETAVGIIRVLGDVVLPGSVNDHLAAAYDKHLFKKAKLNALPAEPRWVINAANLQSGALWRFMAPYMRDWRVGKNLATDRVNVAEAVAASSAFPPMLAPARFTFAENDYVPGSGGTGADDLQRKPFTTRVQLADGGVYDNLGLETAYKRYRTLLVSDAGAPFQARDDVPTNWAGLGKRVVDVVDNQVRALRKRLLLDALRRRERLGAYWAIDADYGAYSAPGLLPCRAAAIDELASVDTDLGKQDAALQERLINWGYAVSDAATRSFLDTSLPPPAAFPYPIGVG